MLIPTYLLDVIASNLSNGSQQTFLNSSLQKAVKNWPKVFMCMSSALAVGWGSVATPWDLPHCLIIDTNTCNNITQSHCLFFNWVSNQKYLTKIVLFLAFPHCQLDTFFPDRSTGHRQPPKYDQTLNKTKQNRNLCWFLCCDFNNTLILKHFIIT